MAHPCISANTESVTTNWNMGCNLIFFFSTSPRCTEAAHRYLEKLKTKTCFRVSEFPQLKLRETRVVIQ